MKPLKKFYCRTVQFVLRAAMPILPYRKPTELNGVADVPPLLLEKGMDRVLLITDDGIRSRGLTTPLEQLLQERGIHCVVYDRTVANPTDRNVEEACRLYRKEGCQALIGFGGGSSMDCAKAVGARLARPRKSLSQMEGVLRVLKKLPLLIAIPTTAGTGSETTLAAVVTDSETRHKYPITDFRLIPQYAVLDPEVTRSLPAFVTACTAMDALTHAIEAYIGQSTTKETRAWSLEAVHLIFQYLDRAVDNGDDMEARRMLLRAAYLAGSAFSKSYVGYVHAVAHSLSGLYDVPHGFTNAVLLPYVLEAYGSAIHQKLAQIAVAAGVAEEDTPAAEAAAAMIAAIRAKNQRYNIPDHIRELRREDIPALARTADHEGNPLYPVPVLMDTDELVQFYEAVLEERHEDGRDTDHAEHTKGVFYRREDPASGKPAERPEEAKRDTGAA